MGFDLLNKKWKNDPVRAEKLNHNAAACFNNLSDLMGENTPKFIANSLEKLFKIKKSAVIKIFDKEGVLGDFILFFNDEKGTENSEILEIFAGQVYMYLKRIKANKDLEFSEKRYHALLNNAGEGILEVDLKGNHTYVHEHPTF